MTAQTISASKISIHALREEGDSSLNILCVVADISIHALREEGDVFLCALQGQQINFYPRPPRGGRRGRTAADR